MKKLLVILLIVGIVAVVLKQTGVIKLENG